MQIDYENTLENNEREFEQFQADQLKLCKQHTIKDIKNLLLSLDNNDKYWNYFAITYKIKLLKQSFLMYERGQLKLRNKVRTKGMNVLS